MNNVGDGAYSGFRVETLTQHQTGRAVVRVTPLEGRDRCPVQAYASGGIDATVRELIGAIQAR